MIHTIHIINIHTQISEVTELGRFHLFLFFV